VKPYGSCMKWIRRKDILYNPEADRK